MSEPATTHAVAVRVNGERVARVVPARQLLVHFLRDTRQYSAARRSCAAIRRC